MCSPKIVTVTAVMKKVTAEYLEFARCKAAFFLPFFLFIFLKLIPSVINYYCTAKTFSEGQEEGEGIYMCILTADSHYCKTETVEHRKAVILQLI